VSEHYVACLDLRARSCLVVGEGAIATEKVEGLAAAGATVARVVPEAYRAEDLDRVWLVVVATSDDELNRRVARRRRSRSGCATASPGKWASSTSSSPTSCGVSGRG